MRIVAWNCQMGLRKKIEALLPLDPDLAVIPECSRESLVTIEPLGYDSLWFGSNHQKGLGVICKRPWSIQPIEPPKQKWIVPINVDTGILKFTLIAVWACQEGSSKTDRYIGLLYKALQQNSAWFQGQQVVVAGDLNSNRIWDSERPVGNHSTVVQILEQHGVISSYHNFFREQQGEETRHTCFLYRHENRPFHLDYVFIPTPWMNRLKLVEVGAFTAWSKLSDHCPILVEIDDDTTA